MDPQTPTDQILTTPSEVPCLTPRVDLTMGEHTLIPEKSPGLAIREREERRNHWKNVKDHLPLVLDASACLQNALGIRNTAIWPTPPLPNVATNHYTMAMNGAKLKEALSACQKYAVRMDRSSHSRDFLDKTVEDLKERTIRTHTRTDIDTYNQADSRGATTAQMQPTSSDIRSEAHTPLWDSMVSEPCAEKKGDYLVADHAEDMNGTNVAELTASGGSEESRYADESPFGGVLLPSSQESSTQQVGKSKCNTRSIDVSHNSEYWRIIGPADMVRDGSVNPLDMPGSFTAAICAYPELSVSPLFSLTLKDVAPGMHNPTDPRCVLLRHFEVGLDEVEGIITGEVKIPESMNWTIMRERRLGRLGLVKTGNGAYSADLEQEQRRNGWGEGKWVFFGVKFKQFYESQRITRGQWLCFGAPIESVEKKAPTTQYIEISEVKDKAGDCAPIRKEKLIRESTLLCLGGPACMDSRDTVDEWDEGVLREVSNAMANVGLAVDTLRVDSQSDYASLQGRESQYVDQLEVDPTNSVMSSEVSGHSREEVFGPTEPPKRKRSEEPDSPRKACGIIKSRGAGPKST